MKRLPPLSLAVVLVASVTAHGGRLWPGAGSAVSALPGAALVETPSRLDVSYRQSAAWPGLRLTPVVGTFDLSAIGALRLSVSNRTGRVQRLHLYVRAEGESRAKAASTVRLLPWSAGLLRMGVDDSPWTFDRDLDWGGMRGVPPAPAVRKRLASVVELQVVCKNAEEPADGAFSVSAVDCLAPDGARPRYSADGFFPFVDAFGQFKHADWPGKTHDEGELLAARRQENAVLSGTSDWASDDYDRFGGWARGPQLKATGRFRTEKLAGRWHLVDPDGHLFFSLGIVGVRPGERTRIRGRASWFEGVPPNAEHFDYAGANLAKQEVDGEGFNARAHRRLHAWGVNTIGNWSAATLCEQRRTPYVSSLTTKGPVIAGAKGWGGKRFADPFSPEFETSLRQDVAAEARRSGEDSWCLGWFVDNEPIWSFDDRYLARGALASPPEQPAKLAAVRWLEGKYRDIAYLNAAWGTTHADWKSLLNSDEVPSRAPDEDLLALGELIARRYFKTIRDVIRAMAPQVLYLGCRFNNGGPRTWRVAAEFCDVVSANVYAERPFVEWPDDAGDKPFLVGEFHFGAPDRGLVSCGLVAARNQHERARMFVDYVRAARDDGRTVGVHWFKWRDQMLTGRDGDGENHQVGFVDICDRPYPEMVDAARLVARELYGRRQDPSLTLLLADVHVNGAVAGQTYQRKRFDRLVDEIVNLNPLPAQAVILGDIARSFGTTEDYRRSQPSFRRLEKAGIRLVFAMGNHDRREAFFEVYPDCRKTSRVPGRLVSVVETPDVDILVLDSLHETEEPTTNRNFGDGELDAGQVAWLKDELPKRKKPFLVAAHHRASDIACGNCSLSSLLLSHPLFAGFLHGHEHHWGRTGRLFDWRTFRSAPSVGLPSASHWGDIGYALMRTMPDRAVVMLRQTDVLVPLPDETRPSDWRDVLEERKGATCTIRFPSNSSNRSEKCHMSL